MCTLEFEDHRPLYDWVVAKCPEVRDDAWVLGCLSKAGGNPEDYRASPETPTPIETEPPLNLCGNQPVRRVHAIEQASRRWRGGRRDDSARTRRKILISTQVGRLPNSEMGCWRRCRRPPQLVWKRRGISWNGSTGGSSTRKSGEGLSCRRSRFVVSARPKRSLEIDFVLNVARRPKVADGIW